MLDCRVRVFGLSDIVDRPSDRLYVHTFPLCGCMDRRSCYIRFYSKECLSIYQESRRRQNFLKNYPLTESPAGNHQGPELFLRTEMPEEFPRPKQYTPIAGRLITQVHVQNWSPDFNVHNNCETRSKQASWVHLITSVGQNFQEEATAVLCG